MKGKKLIVAGSRVLCSEDNRYDLYDLIGMVYDDFGPYDVILSGSAQGPDSFAEEWAFQNTITCNTYVPAWEDIKAEGAVVRTNKYGKKYNALAGHWRNEKMAKDGDALLAYWDGKSTGTRDMIDRALDHGLDVFVFKVNPGA